MSCLAILCALTIETGLSYQYPRGAVDPPSTYYLYDRNRVKNPLGDFRVALEWDVRPNLWFGINLWRHESFIRAGDMGIDSSGIYVVWKPWGQR